MAWPWKTHINENVKAQFDCEKVAKYNAILIANLCEYFVGFI